jgi:uncharacterized protein YbjT (DUF2867 family)
MDKILVSGATGNVGKEVYLLLVQANQPVIAAGRDINKIHQIFGKTALSRSLDFKNPQTFASAFSGITKFFLVRPPDIANVKKYIAPAILAAKQAGVKQVVFLSLIGVEKNKVVPHHKIEQLIIDSGISWTFLRAGFFMQNLSTTHRQEIKKEAEIFLPAGKAKTAFIDVRDIAALAAKALTEEGHVGKAYNLTGNQALDYFEVAEIMTKILGKEITYRNPNPLNFVWTTWQKIGNLPYAFIVTILYLTTRFGLAAKVYPDTEQLLGRPPISLQQFVQDNKTVWS